MAAGAHMGIITHSRRDTARLAETWTISMARHDITGLRRVDETMLVHAVIFPDGSEDGATRGLSGSRTN
jgi:hypothetical protein